MVAIKDRNDPLRLMGRRLLLAVLFMVVLSALWAVWSVYQKERESARLTTEAEIRLADLKIQQEKLQKDLKTLETDRGMEEALRAQYGMGKSGEGVVVIVEPPTSTPIQATSSTMQWLKDILSHL